MTVIECPQCHGSGMSKAADFGIAEFGTACLWCGGQGFVPAQQTELNVVGEEQIKNPVGHVEK